MDALQDRRFWLRLSFFVLFLVAPILDIFRLDLNLGHFILFGQNWTLGLEAFQRGEISGGEAAKNIIIRGFLPIVLIVGVIIGLSFRYGRLYCGWLCPHFSVVEIINALMRRSFGRLSIWDRHPLPEQDPDGHTVVPNRNFWWLTLLAVIAFAFLWSISLLTYMLPPREVYSHLFSGNLTLFQKSFLITATSVFTIEFLFARHLFCRFACAVGIFQSFAWMANKTALVVGFKREQVGECIDCNSACDNACPMRIKPRSTKRHMFNCTQCGLCIQACHQVQGVKQHESVIEWVSGQRALNESDHDFGRGPTERSRE